MTRERLDESPVNQNHIEAIQIAARELVPGGGDDPEIINQRNEAALAILGKVREGVGLQEAIVIVGEELIGPKVVK